MIGICHPGWRCLCLATRGGLGRSQGVDEAGREDQGERDEQSSHGEGPGVTSHNWERSAAAFGRRTCAPERPCVWHPQPRHVRQSQWPNRDSATPNSLLRAIKLWYLIPALLHSLGGRIKRRQRLALVESGDIALLLPW